MVFEPMPVQRRRTRQNSNIFHMLSKTQLVELREAFNLLDADSDSRLTAADLSLFLQSIGSPFSDQEIQEMIQELEPNPTYIVLLTLIGERLSEIQNEKDLVEAFRVFDDDNDGHIDNDVLRSWMTKNDAISREDYDYLVRGCVEGGRVNYRRLSSKMKHGEVMEN